MHDELADIGKRRDALKEAEYATSLNPLSTFAWETLGDVHAEFADFSNARTAWEHALRTDPDNAQLYDKLGLSYWNIAYEGGPVHPQLEDLHRAAAQFEDALTLYESDDLSAQVLTRSRLAKLYSALRDLDEARRHLQIVDPCDWTIFHRWWGGSCSVLPAWNAGRSVSASTIFAS